MSFQTDKNKVLLFCMMELGLSTPTDKKICDDVIMHKKDT